MRLKQIAISRWGSSDEDLSGLKLTNNSGQESELLGKERNSFETINLQ